MLAPVEGAKRKKDRKLVQDSAVLVEKCFRNRLWRKSPQIQIDLRKIMSGYLHNAKRTGVVEVLYNKNLKLEAIFWLFKSTQSFHNVPMMILEVHRNKNSPSALIWLNKKLEQYKYKIKGHCEALISPNDNELKRVMVKNGFHTSSLILLGKTHIAYKNLVKKFNPTKDVTSLGLKITSIESIKDIDQIIKIHRREFKRNPQYGWFVAKPQALKTFKEVLLKQRKAKSAFVFKNLNGKVLGYFSGSSRHNFRMGLTGGVGLCFDKSIQGLGLSKVAYRLILEEFISGGVGQFYGGTSQKPVIKMAKIMGRFPSARIMKFGKGYFRESYFRY